MKIIVTPNADGVVSFMGRINGQPLPDGAVIVEVESLDVAPATAAVVVEGTLKIVPDWRGSGPWYDQNAALADRETPIHITEVGLDPREKPWAMQPRLLTKAEVAAQTKAEAEAKAAEEAEAAANLEITAVQARLAANALGIRDEIEAVVASEKTPRDVKDLWEYSITFKRSNPIWDQFAPLIGKKASDIDAYFTYAKAL